MKFQHSVKIFYVAVIFILLAVVAIFLRNDGQIGTWKAERDHFVPSTRTLILPQAELLLPKRPYCQFDRRRHSAVLLYSAPVASAVYLLNAYDDPAIHGIFKYYLFQGQRYRGPVTWSGITLSVGQLRQLPLRTLIYADPSDDLKRSLKASRKDHQMIDLISAFPKALSTELWRAVMAELMPKMVQDPLCLERAQWLEHWVKTQEELLAKDQAPKKAFFFLGPVALNRLPTYLIANDLLVRDLVRSGRLHWPWPSFERGVFNWSQRQLRSQRSTQYIGLVEELALAFGTMKIESIGEGRSNLSMAGALLPGITQLILQVLLVQSGVMI